jgi:hypothetical protein
MADPDDVHTATDAEVRRSIDRSHQLVAEMERLAHSLNVHLDEIQTMIAERRQEL